MRCVPTPDPRDWCHQAGGGLRVTTGGGSQAGRIEASGRPSTSLEFAALRLSSVTIARRQTTARNSRSCLAGLPKCALQHLEALDECGTLPSEQFSASSEGHTPRASVDEFDSKRSFKTLQVSGEGRLAHVQTLSGFAEVELFGKHEKNRYLLKIHGDPVIGSCKSCIDGNCSPRSGSSEGANYPGRARNS